jgi:hypothetical protein
MLRPSIRITIRKTPTNRFEIYEVGDTHARFGQWSKEHWNKTHFENFRSISGALRYLSTELRRETYKDADILIII